LIYLFILVYREENENLAKNLSSSNINVTFIPLSNVFSIMPKVDKVLIGTKSGNYINIIYD
jgi:translation initiation factor 2B subunit (eIF-2B alpha/beta/delta family)